MSIKICKDGTEPVIREALQYLERRHGLPGSQIQSVSVYAKVNEPIVITVTLFVQDEEPAWPTEDPRPVEDVHLPEIPRVDDLGTPLHAEDVGDLEPTYDPR
jgi:hypothetical protein